MTISGVSTSTQLPPNYFSAQQTAGQNPSSEQNGQVKGKHHPGGHHSKSLDSNDSQASQTQPTDPLANLFGASPDSSTSTTATGVNVQI